MQVRIVCGAGFASRRRLQVSSNVSAQRAASLAAAMNSNAVCFSRSIQVMLLRQFCARWHEGMLRHMQRYVSGPDARFGKGAKRIHALSTRVRAARPSAGSARAVASGVKQPKASATREAHVPARFGQGRREFASALKWATLVASGRTSSPPVRARGNGWFAVAEELRANPSLEATRNGMAPWPCNALVHHAPHGQGAMPPRAPQLKR